MTRFARKVEKKVEIEPVQAPVAELGEGPRWHPLEQKLYWVDIESGCGHRFDPQAKTHQQLPIGMKTGALAFRRQGGLVLATEKGFWLYDPQENLLNIIGDPEEENPQTRLNDGAVDRAGRFWAGSMGDPFHNSLYRLDADGSILRMETGIGLSNGIGWSPDNRVMYFVDSLAARIYRYDFYLDSGHLENRGVFLNRSDQPGVPDGLAVDTQGFVWVAIWGGACLERYDPVGKLECSLPMPVDYPTSLAFGGLTLEDLYITSAKMPLTTTERALAPLAGQLFLIQGAGQGMAEPFFNG